MFSERLWCLFELTGSPVLLVMEWCLLVLGDCSVSISVPGDVCTGWSGNSFLPLQGSHLLAAESVDPAGH